MSVKQKRMEERIRTILSELLRVEIRDDRLKQVTVTRVQLDRELKYADVYVNAMGDESRRDEVLSALERASGFLRRELAQRIQLRTTPELHFHWDLNLEHGERMNRLLDELDIPPGELPDVDEPFSLEDLLDDDGLD
ncbi:MAG: 30S ribosome-binding factor RbfA [Anaerolineae bacterium]|nr:30S ribosome-binding factor RbfA [Anaerolineae bacterium]